MANGRQQTQTRQQTQQRPQQQRQQAPPPPVQEEHVDDQGEVKNQPVHVVRLRNVRAAIWQNQNADNQTYYTITVSRLYKDEGGWRSSSSFGRDDALLLAKAIDQAHTWITNETQSSDVPF